MRAHETPGFPRALLAPVRAFLDSSLLCDLFQSCENFLLQERIKGVVKQPLGSQRGMRRLQLNHLNRMAKPCFPVDKLITLPLITLSA